MWGINVQAIAEKFNLHIHRYLPKSFDRFLFEEYDKKDLIGAEIGTHTGDHAVCLLKNNKIKFMYLIDEYHVFNDAGKYFIDQNKSEKKARKALSKFSGKFEIIKENSDSAHSKLGKESLDFVYIDGGHSYKQVKKDIKNYFPLVKKGGILGGHDFHSSPVNDRGRQVKNGVVEAVLEFINEAGYKASDLRMDYYDWWIIKK